MRSSLTARVSHTPPPARARRRAGTTHCTQVGAKLQKIYFLKSQAGKGYAKQLLQFTPDAAQNQNEGFIWLDVLKSNSDARRFYERFGFRTLGEIPFSTDMTEIGMVVMCLDLSRQAR